MLINYKNLPNRRGYFEFVGIIPDKNQKLYKSLITALTMRKLGQYDEKTNVFKVFLYNKKFPPIIKHRDKNMFIYSSQAAVSNLGKDAKANQYSKELKELNIPKKIQGNGFLYINKRTIPTILAIIKSQQENKIATDFFCNLHSLLIYQKNPENLKIDQYSNMDLGQINFLLQNGMILSWINKLIVKQCIKKDIVEKRELIIQSYENFLSTMWRQLDNYSIKNSGNFPKKDNLKGLEELKIDLQKLQLANFDLKDFYYLGGLNKTSNPNFPLIFSRGKNNFDYVNVLFVNGEVKTFKIENYHNAKQLVSFLHTKYHYSAQDFTKLIKLAEKLDK